MTEQSLLSESLPDSDLKSQLLEMISNRESVYLMANYGIGDTILNVWVARQVLNELSRYKHRDLDPVDIKICSEDQALQIPEKLLLPEDFYDTYSLDPQPHFVYGKLRDIFKELKLDLPEAVANSVPTLSQISSADAETESQNPLSNFDIKAIEAYALELKQKYQDRQIYVIAQFGSDPQKRLRDDQITEMIIPTLKEIDPDCAIVVVSDRNLLHKNLAEGRASAFPRVCDALTEEVSATSGIQGADETLWVNPDNINTYGAAFWAASSCITTDSLGMHLAAGIKAMTPQNKTGEHTGVLKPGQVFGLFTQFIPEKYAPKGLESVRSLALDKHTFASLGPAGMIDHTDYQKSFGLEPTDRRDTKPVEYENVSIQPEDIQRLCHALKTRLSRNGK